MPYIADARAWLAQPTPTESFAKRFRDARLARGEGARECAERLGVSPTTLRAVEWSLAGRATRVGVDAGLPTGPTEPRWRSAARGFVLVTLAVAAVPSVVGYLARATRLRGATAKAGVGLVLATAAFLTLRGWLAAGPDGGYRGSEAFLYVRVNNALAFGLVASVAAGWFANLLVEAPTWRAAASGAAACVAVAWLGTVPLRIANADVAVRLARVDAAHAGFRQEQWTQRRLADREPGYDLADARRKSAIAMLEAVDLPVAPWMRDRRSFALHRSIVAACLDSASRHEVEPESCDATPTPRDSPVDRLGTFAFLFRSQFPDVPAAAPARAAAAGG